MGLSTFMLTAFLVVMTSAGWPGWPTGDNPFAGYHSPMLTSLRFGPISMPNPGIPKFPTIPSPTFLFPFPTMPTFQSIQDMVKTMPNKGAYSGVVVSTQTESKMKDDGTLVKKGGSTILINDDGKVTVHTTGNNPPDLNQMNEKVKYNFPPYKFRPIRPFKLKNVFDSFENFQNFDDFPKFPEIKPIDFDIIKTYQPGNGEKFRGHSIISNSYSTNNNGQVSQGGHIAVVQNDNGQVKEEKIVF